MQREVTLPVARVIPTPTKIEVEAKVTMARLLSRGRRHEAKLRIRVQAFRSKR